MPPSNLHWQSKLILLIVVPCTAVSAVFEAHWFAHVAPPALWWTLGLSALLGVVAVAARAATREAAATGALLTASMMFSAATVPFRPWRSAVVPILTVLVLTSLATRFGGDRKRRLGTAESQRGRGAGQVVANLGLAALVAQPELQVWLRDGFGLLFDATVPFFVFGLAALAEAAADTVSSEVGQVLGGRPFLVTSFRRVETGTDGAISMSGTLAGILAAGAVAAAGAWALGGGGGMLGVAWAGGVFGLLFDSLLGATVERAGWMNNDAVNFTSTGSAAGFALMLMVMMRGPGVG